MSPMDRDLIIVELQRVAEMLDAQSMSRSMFNTHGTISAAAIEATFGSWNEAVVAAGLIPFPQGGVPKSEIRRQERLNKVASSRMTASDEELLDDLLRVAVLLGRRPSGNQLTSKGEYGSDIYKKRWGSIAKAHEAALARRPQA